MKTAFAIMLGVYVVSALVTPILMRLPAQRRAYARMDDRRLAGANTQARMTKWLLLACSFSVLLCLTVVAMVGRTAGVDLVPVEAWMLLGCFGCLVGAYVMREIQAATTVEMDLRKSRVEKQAGCAPLGGGSQGVPMNRARVAIWLFAVACALSLVAALIPILKGDSPNVALLGLGLLWFVIAIAAAKTRRMPKKTPPAA